MTTTILLAALSLGAAPPDRPVTDAEKKAFLELLTGLPTRGEFFADEAITRAMPYTRVLLALTEKDAEERYLYGLLALSRGLVDREPPRRYAIAHFDAIAHPTIKLAWASMLFDRGDCPAEIVAFLRKALDSKEPARTLEAMNGPAFEDFKGRVIRTSERARQTRVELVKRHTIDAFPRGDYTFNYSKENCAFAPDRRLYACRPLKHQGELIAYDLAKGSTSRLAIPQPEGFRPEFELSNDFDNPTLSINSRGAALCRWALRGNGDHGLALLRRGAESFRVARVNLALEDSLLVAEPGGDWYLIHGAPRFAIDRVDGELKLTHLGDFAGQGHHGIGILDARFIAKDVLHLFWGDVLPAGNHLRMRCIDFDVKERTWSHHRGIFRLDRFVSSAADPTVLRLEDGSLHYLWKVDEGKDRGEATGLYYQAEADGQTEKLNGARDYRAIAVGNLIVLCYTLEEAPEMVYFRVINHGTPGPVTEIKAAEGRRHPLRTEYLILGGDGDRIRFLSTVTMNALYELTLQDAKTP